MLGVELIPLPAHRSDTGTLVALDRAQSLPFYLQRMFVIFACARGARRAEHATSAHHALLPVQGGFSIDLDNGRERETLRLDSPDRLICIHAGVWLRLRDLSPETIIAHGDHVRSGPRLSDGVGGVSRAARNSLPHQERTVRRGAT
jgi:hypothetical protein